MLCAGQCVCQLNTRLRIFLRILHALLLYWVFVCIQIMYTNRIHYLRFIFSIYYFRDHRYFYGIEWDFQKWNPNINVVFLSNQGSPSWLALRRTSINQLGRGSRGRVLFPWAHLPLWYMHLSLYFTDFIFATVCRNVLRCLWQESALMEALRS